MVIMADIVSYCNDFCLEFPYSFQKTVASQENVIEFSTPNEQPWENTQGGGDPGGLYL
jgi:hypothetical protein